VNKSERAQFIKPSQAVSGEAILNLNRIIGNQLAGIETTFILDTNVLIRMERVVKAGNKSSSVKLQGLQNLVDFLTRCPPHSVFLSPGQALYEMPPSAAERSRDMFDLFCSVHLPGFVDAPNCIRASFDGPSSYGFFDMPDDVQAVFAAPFTSLLLLQLIDRDPIRTPAQKFNAYLQRIVAELDILSEKEIEIAKYCFAEPPPHCVGLIKLRKEIRKNFLKKGDALPKTAEEAFDIAFNAARDLHLLNAANVMDTNGLDDRPQDCWIVTYDKKLVAFAKMVHNVNLDGEAGKYSAVMRHEECSEDPYWRTADAEHYSLTLGRATYHENRKIELEKFVQSAYRVAEEVRRHMA
jgi:hypothetical protein